MRKIAIVTGARAEYWLLRPLISKLCKKNLSLLVTGEHLRGDGLKKIKEDGFSIDFTAECLAESDDYFAMAQATSRGISNFATAFEKCTPDIVVLLGDRYETYAAASAAYILKIPIAHIHGGEVTHGALDDGFRHAISKMASLHFVSHDEYKKRLLRMGEMPNRVYVVGAIGLDNLDFNKIMDKKIFFEKYNLSMNKDYFLFTLHSTTLTNYTIEEQAKKVIQALQKFTDFNIVITRSNFDPGGAYLNMKWAEWGEKEENVQFIPVLGDDYLSAVFYSKVVIGNSSSGVIEVPYLDRPVINIGNRQAGRITPKGVQTVDFDSFEIQSNIERILNNYTGSEKIYGDFGGVAHKIYDQLCNNSLEEIIYKRFHDVQ